MRYSNEDQQKIFLKERDKNPETFKLLQELVIQKATILYNNGTDFVEVPFDTNFSMVEFNKTSQYAWRVNIRLNLGEPRLIIEVIDCKEIEYIQEYMPCINYFPEALLLEDYGKKWKKVK